MKKIVSLLMASLMVVSLGITGFAEENGIKVNLNGNNISFSETKPIEKNGRVMVPFASLFEAMGAKVKYEDKTIIATLDNKVLKMKEDSNTAELITDGKSEVVGMAAPVLVQKGRSYVPVSTISTVFGFDVYWDGFNESVNIIDSKKLISEIDSKYTIYNKIISSEKVDMEKTYKTTMGGNLDMNIGKELTGEEKDMILAAKTDMELISKGLSLNLKGSVKVDTAKSTVTDMMGEEEKLVENIPFELILNSDNGKVYVNVPDILSGESTEKNEWIELSSDKSMAMSLEQIKQIKELISGNKSLTIGQMVYSIAWSMKDSIGFMGMDVYSYSKMMDKIYELMIADDLFTTSTEWDVNIYTSSMNKTQILSRALKIFGMSEGEKEMKELIDMIENLDYSLVIKEKDSKLLDMSLKMNMTIVPEKEKNEKVNLMMSINGNNEKSDMKLNASMGNSKLDLVFNSIVAETTETVKTMPPVDATILNLSEAIETTTTNPAITTEKVA